jgi:DNA-binding transcriptional LysR family regulator
MVRMLAMHGIHTELAGIDLNLVVALDALLAERHVTRAATRLGLTQSAASHALRRLRDLLSDPLLVRGARGVLFPTPLAERLAPLIRRTLADLAGALRGQMFEPATSRHVFRVGASDYVEHTLLPRLVARIAKLAPSIDLWVHPYRDWGDEELASGQLDIVLGPPRRTARPAGSFEKVLFDESFTTVLRARHPATRGKLTLATYCELTHILVAPRGTPGSLVDDALADVGRSRRVGLAVPHFLVVPQIVATTDLIATLPTRIADIFATPTGLVMRPPPVTIPRFQIAAAWSERIQHDPPQRWLREQVLAVAAEIR